jgi:hypothetical protein
MFSDKTNNNQWTLIFFIVSFLIYSSCNFNITDKSGPQISSTIESSKNHNAFICAYDVNGHRINGLRIESIFAEKKYWLEDGYLGKFKINCCESQLIIKLLDDNTMITLNDIPQNWEAIDFRSLNSKMIVKFQKGIVFPDSITILIKTDVKNKNILDSLTLYKLIQ